MGYHPIYTTSTCLPTPTSHTYVLLPASHSYPLASSWVASVGGPGNLRKVGREWHQDTISLDCWTLAASFSQKVQLLLGNLSVELSVSCCSGLAS